MKESCFALLVVDSSSDSDGDPAVVGGLAHEPDHLVVGGVEDGGVVHGHDLVAGKQPPVHVGRTAGNDVPDRNLHVEKNAQMGQAH